MLVTHNEDDENMTPTHLYILFQIVKSHCDVLATFLKFNFWVARQHKVEFEVIDWRTIHSQRVDQQLPRLCSL